MRIAFRQAAQAAAFFIGMNAAAAGWAAPSLSWTVDCSRGQSINRALDHAPPGFKLTLKVRGTCNEEVEIDRDDVTLQGDPATAPTVSGPSRVNPAIRIIANRIVVDGLTVTGGGDGVRIHGASRVLIVNSLIRNTGVNGISISESQGVSIANSKVKFADAIGIVANRGGFSINDSEIQFNRSGGVHIGSGSQLSATGNTFSSNGAHGLGVFNSSVAMLWTTRIEGNGTDPTAFFRQGVYIYFSHAEFRESNIANNAAQGVHLTGSAHIFDTSISGNGAAGVSANLGATLAIDGGTVSDNQGNGVELATNATGQLSNGINIRSNRGHGVALLAASKLALWSPLASGANGGLGLYCDTAESSAADTSWIAFAPPNQGGAMNCTGY